MFERKKVSHKEQDKTMNGNGNDHKVDLSMPDLSDLEITEGEKQEEAQARPRVSLFKNLFGGSTKQEPKGCGCFSK